MTSPDGENWTLLPSVDDTAAWQAICWSPELHLFCAVGYGGTEFLMTSPNGVDWTAPTIPDAQEWVDICWSPELGLFCAVTNAGTNRIMTSPDGVNWTSYGGFGDTLRTVCWAPEIGIFCVVAINSTAVWISRDGVNWVAGTMASSRSWISVCWAPEVRLFVAVAATASATSIATSPDGLVWTTRAPALTTPQWRKVAWSPALRMFAAVGYIGAGNRLMTSSANDNIRIASDEPFGNVASSITNVGPTGSQSAIQGWLRVNINGVDRFIPYW